MEIIASRAGRLSSFLRQELGLSAGLMNRLKWQQKLQVNGISRHADYQVQPGDRISVDLEEPEPEYPAESGELTVLFEDEHILVVDKPAGMLIHPSRTRNTGTLANRVIGYYQATGQRCAFHPITRLDRDTFGIVLLAKNAHVHGLFTQLLLEEKLCKVYYALVYGAPPQSQGIIDAPIARKEFPSLLREIRPDGKPSVTQYRLLEQLDGCSKLQLQPVTGRTHQLRVHCAHCGFPILGDPQYGSPESKAFSARHGLQTQLLCAKELLFPHPVTGEPLCLRSQMDVAL